MFEVKGVSVGGVITDSWNHAATELKYQLTQNLNDGIIDTGIAMEMTLKRVMSNLRERNGGAWPLSDNAWGSDPNRLASRTGDGLNSIENSIRVNIGRGEFITEGKISTAALTIHETGGTVEPKRGAYMALPLRAALDSRGVPLKSGPGNWTDTFIMRSKRGNPIVFQRRGRHIIPLYLLLKKATIPARLRLGETIDSNLGYFQSRAIEAFERSFDV